MVGTLGTLRLWVQHNVGDIAGLRLTEDDRVFRAASSLPVYRALEDGREITHGVQTDPRGVIYRVEGSNLRTEPAWGSAMVDMRRWGVRRDHVIEVLQDTGRLLRKAERISRHVLEFYIGVLGGRAGNEPRVSDEDRRVVHAVGHHIGHGLNISTVVRDRLMRLVLENVNLWLNRGHQPLGWQALGQSAAARLDAAQHHRPIPAPWRLARQSLEAEAVAASGSNQSIRLPLCDEWLKNFDTVLHWETVRELRDLCQKATILIEERCRLNAVLPLSALRAALQGDHISAAEANTLQRWSDSLRRHRADEEQFEPLISLLLELFSIEGPEWRSRALLAEVLASPEISTVHDLPETLALHCEGRDVAVTQTGRATEYCVYRVSTQSEEESNELWVLPRSTPLARCRLVVRQMGRQDDYPRPSIWQPIPEGGWHVRGRLCAFSDFRETIRNPVSIDAILASEAWMAQVDSWHSGRSLPHAFRPNEMFCEINGGRSRLVWLTPMSPVPFSGEAWESLLKQIFDWMGEQAYLNMTARMGWGHARDTETLRHVVGILCSNPHRIGSILAEIEPHVPTPWRVWIQNSLPRIQSMIDEGMSDGVRKLMDHYIHLNVHADIAEVRERLASAAMEQVRLFGPAICMLPRAFARAVIEVAKATQAELRNPLANINDLFKRAVDGFDPATHEFAERIEECGVACEGDRRNVQQLFRVLFCCQPEERRVLATCLRDNLPLLTSFPSRIHEIVLASQPDFPERVLALLERQLILLSRHVLTQPNEAAVAARAWETAV
jgi:hypothetical protein